MERQEYVWYKDRTFKTLVTLNVAVGAIFSVGVWAVDGEFNPQPIYFFGGLLALSVTLCYLFRKSR